jgi:hypothetical protein
VGAKRVTDKNCRAASAMSMQIRMFRLELVQTVAADAFAINIYSE